MNLVAVYTWVQANWASIAAVVAGLHVLLGAVNKLLPATDQPAWWRKLIDLTGAFPMKGMSGLLGAYSPPGTGSQRADSAQPKGDE
jgi:hypothetical protein